MLLPRVYMMLRYLVSGGTAAVINLGTLFLLVHYLSVYYLLASVLSFVTALAISFTMQKFWTFQDAGTSGIRFQFARYALVTLTINLGINTALMYLFVTILGIWYLVAQVLAAALLAILSFFMYQSFVFVSSERLPSDQQ